MMVQQNWLFIDQVPSPARDTLNNTVRDVAIAATTVVTKYTQHDRRREQSSRSTTRNNRDTCAIIRPEFTDQ